MPKCTFCGSEKTILDTPYVDRVTGKNKTTYCCRAQEQNHQYEDKHFHPIYGADHSMKNLEKL